ncbi:MAG TPA: DUF998 domain-containing protein [Micromonosporaceae bacterium]|nr:DUF998 domain-containing protein [Micromonosporaceae bacterium]
MSQNCTPSSRITRSLLGYGVVAGPCYIVVSLAQALSRDGFELHRHAWSLLANGAFGWIQITNFVVTGLMTVAAAVGLRRRLTTGRGRTWAPLLIGACGLSLVGAGAFRADPAQNFPIGAPDVPTVTWHGMLHFMVGGIGFLCLIIACFVLASRFAGEGRTRMAWWSRAAGISFLAGFVGIASGSAGPTTLAFVAAVVIIWTWLTTVSMHFVRTAV